MNVVNLMVSSLKTDSRGHLKVENMVGYIYVKIKFVLLKAFFRVLQR